MTKAESPLTGPDGPLLRFAADLRRLRARAGQPTYRQLGKLAHYSAATLSEAAGGRKLPTLAVTLAYVRACGADETPWPDRWHEVAAELASAAQAGGEAGGVAPYPGAAGFQAAETERFFGRDAVLAEVRARLGAHRLLLLTGDSGAGLSSLLRAGLLPQVEAEGGRVLLVTLGSTPLADRADALAELTGETAAEVLTDLRRAPETLPEWLHRMAGDTELLLVLDQCERLDDSAEALLTKLTHAATAPDSRIRVILAGRADFRDHLHHLPAVAAALPEPARITLPPMTADELRQAVLAPALAAGLTVETALLSRIVAETCGQPGGLALLAAALRATWRHRRGNTLTLTGYERAGGIQPALAHTAETVHNGLDPDRQRLLRQVFLRLSDEDGARRLDRAELDPDPRLTELLHTLADARVLTLGQDSIRLAHDGLLRSWPRLRDWLAADGEGRRIHRALTTATLGWTALGRDPDLLYRGNPLAQAEKWAFAEPQLLSDREREFLAASAAARASEQAAATHLRGTRRRVRLVLGALLASTLLTLGVAVHAQVAEAGHRDLAAAHHALSALPGLGATDPALTSQLALAAHRMAPSPASRGPLLSSQAVQPATRLTGHTDLLRRVLHSPDGRLLASAGRDRTVRLWQVTEPHRPRHLATLTGHTSTVTTLAFTPDSRTLASSGEDNLVRLWDVSQPGSPAQHTVLNAHQDHVYALSFSPDGTVLATGGLDSAIRLWEVSNRREPRLLSTVHVPGMLLNALTFTPDGRTLAAGGRDGIVRLWPVRPGGALGEPTAIPGYQAEIESLAVSPDNRLLAVAGAAAHARLWDITGPPREIGTVTGHTDQLWAVAFSPDGRSLATSSADQTTRLWSLADPAHPRELLVLSGHTNAVYALSFSPDGHHLATAGDRSLRRTDLRQLALSHTQGAVSALALRPDGNLLAVASADGAVRLWDPTDPLQPKQIGTITGHPGGVTETAFSPDGRTLLTSGNDHRTTLWDVSTPARPRARASLADHTAYAAAFTPDGRTLATGGSDYAVRLWNLTDPDHPRPLPHLGNQNSAVFGVAFTPDGRLLASAGGDKTLRLWDVSDPHQPRILVVVPDSAAITALTTSPTAPLLATGHSDNTLRLWDLTTPAKPVPLAQFTGHTDAITALAFASDGQTLASTSTDRTVRLWDLRDRRQPVESAVLHGHSKAVLALAFWPAGRLATAGDDQAVRLWDTDPEAVAGRICAAAERMITEAEWARYLPGTTYQSPC